jgi:hypothetical protein
MSAIPDEVLSLLPAQAQEQIKSVLWHGANPCSQCGGTLHCKFEQNAEAYVCSGCYNDFAVEKGWESGSLSIEEKAAKYDGLITHLKFIKGNSSIGNFIDLSSDLLEFFA